MGSVAVPSGYLSYVEWYELYGRTSSFELESFFDKFFENHIFCWKWFTSKNHRGSSFEVQLLADTKYHFCSFWECQKDRLFPHKRFQIDVDPMAPSTNQIIAHHEGASIWKPSWLYSDASYIAAFLSCWYRHNTWSINTNQTIYLCLLAICLILVPCTLLI